MYVLLITQQEDTGCLSPVTQLSESYEECRNVSEFALYAELGNDFIFFLFFVTLVVE